MKYFPQQFGASGKTLPGRGGGRVMLTVRKVFLQNSKQINQPNENYDIL